MSTLHNELVSYLRTMISPEHLDDCVSLMVANPSEFDWPSHKDGSVHALIVENDGNQDDWVGEAYRVLKPGAHLLLAAPEDELTGFTGACAAEDIGFEVRDAICVVAGEGAGDRLHYVAKASRGEREEGLNHLPEKVFGMSGGAQGAIARAEEETDEEEEIVLEEGDDTSEDAIYEAGQGIGLNRVQKRRNTHPTVKPVAVMERLLHDVPKDAGAVVDPFMGSGTTGLACLRTGHDFIGIEQQEEYLTIAEGRVRYWNTKDAGWNAAKVVSDLDKISEAQDAEPETMTLDDLFGF